MRSELKLPKQNGAMSSGDVHPLIARTRQALEEQRPNEYQMIYAIGTGTLHVRVSRRLIARALRILGAIVRGCEARHWPVEATDEKGISRVRIGQDAVSFSLLEKTRRFEVAADELPAQSMWQPRYRYQPTGMLVLQVCEQMPADLRRSWCDGRRQRLEDILPEFVNELEKVSAAVRRRRLSNEEWHRRWNLHQRSGENHALHIKEEMERERLLFKQAAAWRKTVTLREMIAEVRRRAAVQPSLWPRETVQQWLCRAETLLQRLDPFANEDFQGALPLIGRVTPQTDAAREYRIVGA